MITRNNVYFKQCVLDDVMRILNNSRVVLDFVKFLRTLTFSPNLDLFILAQISRF